MKQGYVPDEPTIALAITALDAILQESSLRDSWAETRNLKGWLGVLHGLAARLRSVNTLPVRQKKNASLPRTLGKLCELPDIKTNHPAREKIRKALARLSDVNAESSATGFESPICLLVRAGLLEEVKILVERGANVNRGNRVSPGAPKALQIAAAQGDVEMVKYLLGVGADVCSGPSKLYSPALNEAVAANAPEIIDLLVGAGAPLVQQPDISHQTLVHLAASRNAAASLRHLVVLGLDCGESGHDGETRPLLLCAVAALAKESFLLLLELGANTNAKYQDRTILGWSEHWKELRLHHSFWERERDSAAQFDFFIDHLKAQGATV